VVGLAVQVCAVVPYTPRPPDGITSELPEMDVNATFSSLVGAVRLSTSVAMPLALKPVTLTSGTLSALLFMSALSVVLAGSNGASIRLTAVSREVGKLTVPGKSGIAHRYKRFQ